MRNRHNTLFDSMFGFIKCLLLVLSLLGSSVAFGQKSTTYLFVGSYTDGKPNKGLYVYEFNSQTGQLTAVTNAENITNPAFLVVAPNGKYIYACTETQLKPAGSITAFSFDVATRKLTLINKQSSGGENPVYVAVSNDNKFVVSGNYTGGSLAVFKTNADGSLNPYTELVEFSGSSINKARQEKPHIHSTVFSPNNDYLFCPDLGTDKIHVFAFNPASIKPLSPQSPLTVQTIPGSGPRHFTFHPNQKFAYCVEELSGMVSVYKYAQGRLEPVQRIFSYSKTQLEYGSADIHISPDGRFLYASNRKDAENNISIFSINPQDGQLALIGHQSTFGDHPRNFTLDPSGNFLLVANQFTNNIVVFKRDNRTGLLTRTATEISLPSPSCLVMRTYPGN